jgi:nucleotide-binding universal stress UspA family protein
MRPRSLEIDDDPSTAEELRILLPLAPEESTDDLTRLLPALFPPERTHLRRIFVQRPIDMDVVVPEGYLSNEEITRLEIETEAAARAKSETGIEPLAGRGFRVETDIVCGNPAAEILREQERWSADLVAARTRRPDARDERLGALTSALLHHGTVPVLIYRQVRPEFRVRRIVIPSDFSKISRTASDWGLALARLTGADVHMLYVLARHASRAQFAEAALERAGTDEIERLRAAAAAGSRHPTAEAHVRSADTPAEGILNFAAELDADLIAMAGTGRSATWAVLLGSNARTVTRMSRCPVLLIPQGNRVEADALARKLGQGVAA